MVTLSEEDVLADDVAMHLPSGITAESSPIAMGVERETAKSTLRSRGSAAIVDLSEMGADRDDDDAELDSTVCISLSLRSKKGKSF